MLGFGHCVDTLSGGRGTGGTAGPTPVVTAMFMGQSELEYLFDTGPYYRNIPQPVPGNGNVVVFKQGAPGTAPVRTVVDQTTVTAGQVNPAMAWLSGFLATFAPGRTFIIGDGCVSGTNRPSLVDDANPARNFSDFAAVATAIEGEAGAPVGHLIENWYGSDEQYIGNFKQNYWPLYFGTTGAGAPFTLGQTHDYFRVGNATPETLPVDHCLWDATADPAQKGRGLFARADTRWHVLTPRPFVDAPSDVEAINFSVYDGRTSEPDRQVMIELAAEAAAQSVGLVVGPSGHVSKFGPNDALHPDVSHADGQLGLVWPFALALLRAVGHAIAEPVISAIEGPPDGTYADLVVDLPNGGLLSTLNALRGDSYTGTAPHRQDVTGVEILRNGSGRRPVFRETETTYPVAHRGTVTVVDPGSGSPRRGRVRVTPETSFAFGDSLSYLRGQATAATLLPRDYGLYADMLVEHLPGLHDNTAEYPFEGVAVRPLQAELVTPVAAPAFTARGATFDGASYFFGNPLSLPAGQTGTLSMWYRNTQASWQAASTGHYLMDMLWDSGRLRIWTASGGRLQFRMDHGSGAVTRAFNADANSTPMVEGNWYHLAVSYDTAGNIMVLVNGNEVVNLAVGGIIGSQVTRLALGCDAAGRYQWVGDMGHAWIDVGTAIDFTAPANLALFNAAGTPQNLGPNGETPTGSAPVFYFDGDVPSWGNQGTAGPIPLTGALTASGVPGA